jgi:integrase
MTDRSVRNVVTRAAATAGVRPYRIEGGRGEPNEVSPHTFRHSIAFRLIRREDKRLEDVMLRLRHASLQTTDGVYGHFRRR